MTCLRPPATRTYGLMAECVYGGDIQLMDTDH